MFEIESSANLRKATRNFREALRSGLAATVNDDSLDDSSSDKVDDGEDDESLKLKMRDLICAIRSDETALSSSAAAAVNEAPEEEDSPPKAPAAVNHHAMTLYNDESKVALPPSLTESKKDDLLEALLLENERLKSKINVVVGEAESSLASFSTLQEGISRDFVRQLADKERRNASLYFENEKLREMVASLQDALQAEKAEVGRACALIERLGRLRH